MPRLHLVRYGHCANAARAKRNRARTGPDELSSSLFNEDGAQVSQIETAAQKLQPVTLPNAPSGFGPGSWVAHEDEIAGFDPSRPHFPRWTCSPTSSWSRWRGRWILSSTELGGISVFTDGFESGDLMAWPSCVPRGCHHLVPEDLGDGESAKTFRCPETDHQGS